jgi:hypothetical protein
MLKCFKMVQRVSPAEQGSCLTPEQQRQFEYPDDELLEAMQEVDLLAPAAPPIWSMGERPWSAVFLKPGDCVIDGQVIRAWRGNSQLLRPYNAGTTYGLGDGVVLRPGIRFLDPGQYRQLAASYLFRGNGRMANQTKGACCFLSNLSRM